jgi:chorismate dehydratase
MEQRKLRVAAVSYTNTIPFIYGLTEYTAFAGRSELHLMPPAQCAEVYRQGLTDFALVPVGALSEDDLSRLCCNWCLGANGAVESVILFSAQAPETLHTIYLDTESRTSVLLVRVLYRHLWNTTPQFLPLTPGQHMDLGKDAGVLLIGDKTFGMQHDFQFSTDLSEAWNRLTGLPFVFACWVASPEVTQPERRLFDDALAYGIQHIDESIALLGSGSHSQEWIRHYLTNCISYELDEQKLVAISVFKNYCRNLDL